VATVREKLYDDMGQYVMYTCNTPSGGPYVLKKEHIVIQHTSYDAFVTCNEGTVDCNKYT
jgi:hypothetical protein